MFSNIIEGQGLPLMIVGMSVVFGGLLILMFMMKGLKFLLYWIHCHQIKSPLDNSLPVTCSESEEVSGVVMAAIALTLILEQEEAHDEESMVLTLRALPKPYSNWWMNELQKPWSHNTVGSHLIPEAKLQSNLDSLR